LIVLFAGVKWVEVIMPPGKKWNTYTWIIGDKF
jgi:hypothetical protein